MRPARWYRLVEDEVVGPVGLAEVRRAVLAGELGPDDAVWSDGMPDWLPARDVPALVPPPRHRAGTAWADEPAPPA